MHYPTLALRGAFIPLWLLARPDIEHGAKLLYALLIQKVGPKGMTRIYIPALAAELGDEEEQINLFLTEIEKGGLIEIQKLSAGVEFLQCTFSAHPWVYRVQSHGGSGKQSRTPGPPNSSHSQETCIEYAKAKQRAGEEIRNVYALGTHFYKTGNQDAEIDIFLRNGKRF
jgi:hypothetical protein